MPAFHNTSLRALCLSMALASVATAADSVLLKPRHDASRNSYVEIDIDTVQKLTGPDGKPSEMKSRSLYGLMQSATPKGDGAELTFTLDRLRAEVAFSEAIRSFYDTDDPDNDDASPTHKEAFNPILNMQLKITIDADGLARSADGGAAIRKKLTDLGDQNFVAKGVAEGDLTDRQIMTNFGEFPVILCPNRDVKVGQTWKKTQHDEIPQVGKVIVNYECKLDRIEKADGAEFAVVTYKGTLAKNPDDKAAKDQRLGKIDGTFSGTARFDTGLGRFVDITRDTSAILEVQPWWTKDLAAPLMKLDTSMKHHYTWSTTAGRLKTKAEIAQRVADAKARREAEEAAAMAGPVDPVTPENAPEPWLQWGGPNRDFKSNATGLANRWPKSGPPRLWERPLGDGFATILCDGDTLYTAYSVRDKADQLKGDEFVVALDARTGKTRWEHKYPAPWTKDLQMEFGAGPHSTPLIIGDRIVSVGSTAIMHCLDRKTGKPIWSKDLHAEYKAELLMRGYGSSPLAYKGSILLPVSKEKGMALMAFNPADGSVVWKGGDFAPGYASLLAINVDGVEQLVAFSGDAVLGIDPTDRAIQWTVKHPTQWGANISTPLWNASDKMLFISSAYGMGSRGIRLEAAGSQVAAKEAWFNPKMRIQHGDAVRLGDWIYGSSGDFGPTFLACLNAATGEFKWRQRGIARANVLYADGKIIVLDEDGALYLVKADPERYHLLAKTTGLCKKTAWTVPTLVGRTLYLRDREKIMALDLGVQKEMH